MESAPVLHQLACEDVEPLLPMVADGAIDCGSDPAVFAHLARCNECQDVLARHDLITIALAQGGGPQTAAPVRGWHYRLPWPAAAAAVVAVAVLTGWALERPARAQPALAAAKDYRVLQIIDGKLGHPVYAVVTRDGKVMIIDPQAVDGASSAEARELHPVVDNYSTH